MKKTYNWLSHLFNFLAVILGVYMAFYINERAKTNGERKESLVLMKSLVTDLSADIKTYEDYQIPFNKNHLKEIENLLNATITGNMDDLSSGLSAAFQVENGSPNTTTYSSMKAAGKLGLINSLSLQMKLNNYYEGLAIESIRKGEFQVDYFSNELLPWVTRNVDLVEMKLVHTDELYVLRNKVIVYQSLVDQKVASYEILVNESKELKSHLDSILKVN